METKSISVQANEKEVEKFIMSLPWENAGFRDLKVELFDRKVCLCGTFRDSTSFSSTWEIGCRGTSIQAHLVESKIGSEVIPAHLAFGEFRSATAKSFEKIPFIGFGDLVVEIDLKSLLVKNGLNLNFTLTRATCNRFQFTIDAGPASSTFSVHTLSNFSANSIRVIVPYWINGAWVFDDPAVNLEREPFVCGIPEMIDKLVVGIPNARSGFRLLFSETRFPDYQVEYRWVREEGDGNWYASADGSAEGWLCPALFRYFARAPKRLFVKAEPINSSLLNF